MYEQGQEIVKTICIEQESFEVFISHHLQVTAVNKQKLFFFYFLDHDLSQCSLHPNA